MESLNQGAFAEIPCPPSSNAGDTHLLPDEPLRILCVW